MVDTDRNNDLTDKQIRGIDLVVKSVSKKYPFILGWEFTETWKKYHYHLYIDLYVDWKLISEFYNEPLRDFYTNHPEMVDRGASLFSYIGFDESVTTQDDHFQKGYNEGMKIKSLMEKKGSIFLLPLHLTTRWINSAIKVQSLLNSPKKSVKLRWRKYT
jgi:hypothetical protein